MSVRIRRRTLFLLTVVLVTFTSVPIVYFFFQEDGAAYHQVLERARGESSLAEKTFEVHQYREGIVKEGWVSPYYFILNGKQSTVSYTEDGALVERLEKVEGKIESQLNRFRFNAPKVAIDYSARAFELTQLQGSLDEIYSIRGERIAGYLEEPMELIALGALDIEGNDRTFSVNGRVVISPEKHRFHAVAEDGLFHLSGVEGDFWGEELSVDFDPEWNVRLVSAKGNVKLSYGPKGLERLLMADRFSWDPQKEELLFFSGESFSKVLYFDPVNQINMSASLLKMSFSMKKGLGAVQGVGPVRFQLTTPELDLLKHF